VANNELFFLGMCLIFLGVYFLPSAVANQREHHNAGAIFLLICCSAGPSSVGVWR
jgi:hypothetical protein